MFWCHEDGPPDRGLRAGTWAVRYLTGRVWPRVVPFGIAVVLYEWKSIDVAGIRGSFLEKFGTLSEGAV